ncbi:MAG: P83/100 family protein, partial [Spirochaetota bacterium]
KKSARYLNKYTVIHAIDPFVSEKLDASIFIIEKDAQVDHIRNLRLMIAGYLETYFEYSLKDSILLAEFITYYDAVFRGKFDYFKEKYKEIVLNHLTPERVGLAISYKEWPGNSLLVVPLTEGAQKGKLSSLQTDALTEKEVIAKMKTEEDMGVEKRSDMVDLKERQVEEAQRDITAEKQAAEQAEQKISVQVKEVLEQKQQIEEEKKQVQQLAAAGTSPEKVERKQEEIKKKEEEVKKQEEKIVQEKAAVEEEKQAIAEKEEKIASREQAIQAERKDVASDKEKLLEKQKASEQAAAREVKKSEEKKPEEVVAVVEERKPTVALEDTSGMLSFVGISKPADGSTGKIILYNPKTRRIVKESSLNTIRERHFDIFESNILVIAGTDTGVNLVLLDGASLEIKTKGSDSIFESSIVKINGPDIFAVVKDGSGWVIGKFDRNLSLKTRSNLKVEPYTAMIIKDGILFVQADNGEIISLNAGDFTKQ